MKEREAARGEVVNNSEIIKFNVFAVNSFTIKTHILLYNLSKVRGGRTDMIQRYGMSS